jgi:DNA replication protein DnaC
LKACKENSAEYQELKEATIRQGWKDKIKYSFLFSEKNISNFDKSYQLEAYNLIKNYDLINGGSIILYSPQSWGVGKTHLSYALIDRYIKEYPATYTNKFGDIMPKMCPVYFTLENELMLKLRSTYNEWYIGESEEQIYNRLNSYRMLIIDDLGKVQPSNLNFTQNVFFRLIDSRYNSGKPIMITMNMDLEQLVSYLGEASVRRLKDMCGDNIIRMNNKSYKVNKAN